ncbi:MAG: response regulator, partial [Clostridiales bacterium]|nr:response regulator [Clostridiales bacterium]
MSAFSSAQTVLVTVLFILTGAGLVALFILIVLHDRIKRRYQKDASTLASIYESIPDLLFCIDTDNRYTSCNRSFLEAVGRTEAEVIGKTPFDIHKDREVASDFVESDNQAMRENRLTTHIGWLTYPDGSVKLLETIKNPIVQDGVVTGLLGISRDITLHRQVEDAARASSDFKSLFLAHMSHEIRTPINVVMGMTELVMRRKIPPELYESMLEIKNASENLFQIINDVLDFSKIEAGKLEIVVNEYSFSSFIHDIVTICRVKIAEKTLFFLVNADSAIPERLIGDDVRLKQIVLNILYNAIKYTQDGYVSLAVSCELENNTANLVFEVSDSGIGIKEDELNTIFNDFVRVDHLKNKSIGGTGLGLSISKNLCQLMGGDISVDSKYGVGSRFVVKVPQIFTDYAPYTRVEDAQDKSILVYEQRLMYADSIMRSIENLGTRATLVKTQKQFFRELELQNYKYLFVASFLYENVKDNLDKIPPDARVVLLSETGDHTVELGVARMDMPVYALPIANILNHVESAFGRADQRYAAFTAPQARVLLVDDASTNLKVAEGLMQPYYMQIDACKSGFDALTLVQQNRYDIIFMDHMMPEMDGIETTAKIRAFDNEYCANVPIIALTANAVVGMREMFLSNGMDDLLTKPIEVPKLNAVLEKWIPREKRMRFITNDKSARSVSLSIDGVDVKAGISMTGGSIENYLDTLSIFKKDMLEKMPAIRQCTLRGDWKLYGTYIHAVRGVTAIIGARAMSEKAREL